MILVKVVQDGKETYQKIDLSDAIKFDKDSLIFTTEDDEDEFDDYLEELEDKKEDELDELEDKIDDLKDKLDDLEDEIDDSKDTGYFDSKKDEFDARKESIKSRIEALKKQKEILKNSIDNDIHIDIDLGFNDLNARQIYRMLPFLGKEKVRVIAKEKIKGNPKFKNVNLIALLPFMEKAARDEIFMEILKDETYKDDIYGFGPFVSKEALDYLCDEYCKGELDYIDINKFYPFMSSDSLSKLFEYFINK